MLENSLFLHHVHELLLSAEGVEPLPFGAALLERVLPQVLEEGHVHEDHLRGVNVRRRGHRGDLAFCRFRNKLVDDGGGRLGLDKGFCFNFGVARGGAGEGMAGGGWQGISN